MVRPPRARLEPLPHRLQWRGEEFFSYLGKVGVTVWDLSDLTGIGRQTIYGWRTSKHAPRGDLLAEVFRAVTSRTGKRVPVERFWEAVPRE